jgi:protein-tyrosine phosphatase
MQRRDTSFAVELLKRVVEYAHDPDEHGHGSSQARRKEVHMPLWHQLRSFWWFLEGRVGGMGRPGFNQCHWFELSFEEGLLLSWLGKQHLPTPPLDSLWQYLDSYGPKVAVFYELSPTVARERLSRLHDRAALLATAERMNAKTGIFETVSWVEDQAQPALRLIPSVQRRQQEVALLKQHNVTVLISLLEQPLDHPELRNDFELYHLPVEDITPPRRDQVYAFAETLLTALMANKTVVTHCLAGIGRTTTMLMAAYLVYGSSLQELSAWVRVRNPHFAFRGSQMAFLQELAEDIQCGRAPVMASGRSLPLWP